MPKFFDRVWVETATTGTGPITFGAARDSYITPAEAGAEDADEVVYVILDDNSFEIGTGVIGDDETTLTRTVRRSKINGTVATDPIDLSGNATVFLNFGADDINEILAALADKANASDVTAALALKADLEIIRFVPVRQTVLTGPVNANGRADFLAAGTGLQVVSNGVADTDGNRLTLAFGDGFDELGAKNYVSRRVSAFSFGSLTNNTTCFLYVELDPGDGSLTFGHGTLAPAYSFARPSSPSTGQYWYPIDHRSRGEVWNGTAWVPTLRVYVGEAVVVSSNVTSVTSYAYQRKYVSAGVQGAVETAISFNHNLGVGVDRAVLRFFARPRSTVNGWGTATAIALSGFATGGSGGNNYTTGATGRNSAAVSMGTNFQIHNFNTSGSPTNNWNLLDIYLHAEADF